MRRLSTDARYVSSRRVDRAGEKQLSFEDVWLRRPVASIAKAVHEDRIAMLCDERSVFAGLVVQSD